MHETIDFIGNSWILQAISIIALIIFISIFVKVISSGIFLSYFDSRLSYEKTSRDIIRKEELEESLKRELELELDQDVK